MLRSGVVRRVALAGSVLAVMMGAVACETLGRDPDLATMMIYLPSNDTVIVDIETGVVTSGPITIFGDVDFSTEFFATDGTPDNRVTELRFRLDVTPQNTSIVTFSRTTQFAGSLNKVGVGDTQIRFQLFNLETLMYEFDWMVDISVN